jgi:hypothetical protein
MSNIVSVKYCNETLELIHKIEQSFLELGERLSKIRDQQLWVGRNDSFAEFLQEASISEGTASKLIQVYQRLIKEYKLDVAELSKIPWTKLYTLLPLIKDADDAKEKVEKFGLMSRQDITEELRDIKHPDCKHEWIRVQKCTKCFKTRLDYES